ncbi:MAG: HEAT repeat domain-containing protein [Deltaproteobacteria bacterium]|nr:HEAT repeat domain-containing protein [Deltaproteobacteria bacterium]
MKQDIPTPEIIDDLLSDNWQLRWQVLEIFDQVRAKFRHHAKFSREQKEVSRLAQKLCTSLNGPNDHNLHLILAAAYFLGGNHFIFLIFNHLGIDDSDDFYPALAELKKTIISRPDKNGAFFDYFHTLLRSAKAVESTTALAATLAVRLFPPTTAFALIATIPYPEVRRIALDFFQETHPQQFFNNYLFTHPQKLLQTQPDLLRFIALPLSAEQASECSALAAEILDSDACRQTAIDAIGRLKLNQYLPLLRNENRKDHSVNSALAQLGEADGCRNLLLAAGSWRQEKRLAALAGLGFCNLPAAVTLLEKRFNSGDRKERALAVAALGRNRHPQALPVLLCALERKMLPAERCAILKVVAQHPDAAPNPVTANRLARWHDQAELYPELFEALARFGYGEEWGKILAGFELPFLTAHQQKIIFFMTRFSHYPLVREKLLSFLSSIDWTFSYRLLQLLHNSLNHKDLRLLLKLLQECEEARELTIQERLNLGDNPAAFSDALCEYLNLNPEQSNLVLSHFIAGLVTNRLPTESALTTDFHTLPADLKKLISGTGCSASTPLEPSLPLRHFLPILSEIDHYGSSSFIAIVNRTRKYNGFLRQLISLTICRIVRNDADLRKTQALPDLRAIINFIRQRPDFDELRHETLLLITEITRRARDIIIYLDATRDRDLRVIKVKRVPSIEHPRQN